MGTVSVNPEAKVSDKLLQDLRLVRPNGEGLARNVWIQPPLNPETLVTLLRLNALHESAIHLRSRLICSGYRPHRLNKNYTEHPGDKASQAALLGHHLKEREFRRFLPLGTLYGFVFDRCLYGYAALQIVRSRGRSINRLARINGRTLRVHTNGDFGVWFESVVKKSLNPDQVIYSFQPSPESDFYGMPEYTGALNDIALAAAAKGQRIHFYNANGLVSSLLLMNVDLEGWIRPEELKGKTPEQKAALVAQAEKMIVEAFVSGNTPGGSKQILLNFRGLLKDRAIDEVFKYVELSQSLAKDDFAATVGEARNSIYEAHQLPSELLNTAMNKAATPDFNKVLANYYRLVIEPVAEQIEQEINDKLEPEQWIKLDPDFEDLLVAVGAGPAKVEQSKTKA